MYELPLFPLETVLFPGTPIHLHIFEPRYRMMIKRCIEESRPFGVALIRRGLEAGAALPEPNLVGCTARIATVEPYEDGRMDLTALGEERFRILGLSEEQPYLTGRVESWQLEHSHSLEMQRGARRLEPWIRRYLELANQAEPDNDLDLASLELPDDPLMLLYWSAALLQLPAYEKQPLLESPAAGALLAQVTRLCRREVSLLHRLMGVEEAVANRVSYLN
jgi:Lon protease-like protein